jgi:hypothetical protein
MNPSRRGKGEKTQLVTDFLNIEKTNFCSDVGIAEVLDTVDDGGADSEGDAVIVGFSDAAEGGDVSFDEVVLRQI